MSLRFCIAGLTLTAVVASLGCRTSSSTSSSSTSSSSSSSSRSGTTRDESYTREIVDLRSERGPESNEAVYERAAALATSSEGKARALVALGRAQLERNRIEPALKSFYEARRLAYHGNLAGAINVGIGDAYFAAGNHSLAGRYLLKAAGEASPRERDLIHAKLVVVSRALNDLSSATRWRGKLSQPISPEVRQILDRGSRFDPDLARVEPDPMEPLAAATRPTTPNPPATNESQLLIFSRANWKARLPRKNIEPMGRVGKITVHHSGGDDVWSASETDTADEIRKIQRYHQNEQGWADIGYHYVVDRGGAIWQGRKLCYQGAHARGSANTGNIGVVLLGNYMNQSVSKAQKESLELLLETLCEHFSLPANHVYTHREILGGKTDCPGPALTQCVKEIRVRLGRRLVAYTSRDRR